MDRIRKRHVVTRMAVAIVQAIARFWPLMNGFGRARLQSLCGVRFADVRTVFLGRDVYMDALHPELITVGRHVRITEGARILTHYLDADAPFTEDRPFRYYTGSVVIEDYAFIGMGAMVVRPVKIGRGSIVGAHSVVAADVEPYAIVAGVPAKVVGYRKR